MFDIKPDEVNGLSSQTNKLLYNIWQELKQLRPSREDTAVLPAPVVAEKPKRNKPLAPRRAKKGAK